MLAFVHIEKCGGTTLEHTLRRYFGCDHFDLIPRNPDAMLGTHEDLRRLFKLRPTLRSIAGHSVRRHCCFEEVIPNVTYITLLRDPINRYVSEFRHFVDVLNYPGNFEQWLDRDDRCNFQTKAIAGVEDASIAIKILEERFCLVGTVECYDDFIIHLAKLLRCNKADLWYQVKNRAVDRRRLKPLPDLSQYHARIIENNQQDIELYKHVTNFLLPKMGVSASCKDFELAPFHSFGARSRIIGLVRLIINRVYRNLIYKPSIGYLPVPHALKIYRKNR